MAATTVTTQDLTTVGPVHPRNRLLMGPGPSTVPPRVLSALAAPTLGHLDPQFIQLMDETCQLLRDVFRTKNRLTFPVSGTGMAGMETIAANLIEPGDEVIVCINGVFGARMQDVMQRCGATVHPVKVDWGQTFSEELLAGAINYHNKAKLLAIVQAETSTGAHQPLEAVSKRVHEAGMLFVVDAVTSLGGQELAVDEWGIDAVYSGTQKCLACPPGLSPVSFSDAAVSVIEGRRHPCQSWYLDVSMLKDYYFGDGGRAYHHTPPINMIYALREALAMVIEEGLERRVQRHRDLHDRLRSGLEELGLSYIPERSLCTLNCVRVPDGTDEAAIRRRLLDEFDIEIGSGLGEFAGKAWRIGLMAYSASHRNVSTLLAALRECL